jgi:hypothetical protein
MTIADTSVMSASPHMEAEDSTTGALLRTLVIGLTAFLTVVDLFATQAILPSLVKHYQVSRSPWALRSMPAPSAWPWPVSPSPSSASGSIASAASC